MCFFFIPTPLPSLPSGGSGKGVPTFPVAILQVSKPGQYEEYVLAFHEFAVFVDANGQRSREHDIKFTRLPISIAFMGA